MPVADKCAGRYAHCSGHDSHIKHPTQASGRPQRQGRVVAGKGTWPTGERESAITMHKSPLGGDALGIGFIVADNFAPGNGILPGAITRLVGG